MQGKELDEGSKSSEVADNQELSRQIVFYFTFALLMIVLNIIIQNLHRSWFVPLIQDLIGHWQIIQDYYLSTSPYDMPELIGSILAVGITYIIKFFLDKYLVFKKTESSLKETGKQFSIYFAFAIMTTLENIGIQFVLAIISPWALNIRIIIALTCGYITKFILDKNFSFKS